MILEVFSNLYDSVSHLDTQHSWAKLQLNSRTCELQLSVSQEGGVLLSDISLQAEQGRKIFPDGIIYCTGFSGTVTMYPRGPPLNSYGPDILKGEGEEVVQRNSVL